MIGVFIPFFLLLAIFSLFVCIIFAAIGYIPVILISSGFILLFSGITFILLFIEVVKEIVDEIKGFLLHRRIRNSRELMKK